MVQDFLNTTTLPVAGLVLTGSFITRKYMWPTMTYPFPTLTIGGELDGLCRVTRITEAYYQQVVMHQLSKTFPVVVLSGTSHFQFAGEGPIPALVKLRDLIPEAAQADVWAQLATLTLDFMGQVMQEPSAGIALAAAVQATGAFVEPIIAAFKSEGGRYFNGPRQIGGPLASACVRGGCPDNSAWAPNGQLTISDNVDSWAVTASNEFVDLTSNPLSGGDFHLPNITRADAHTLSITTYTQCTWDSLDAYDTGFSPIAAAELGTKLYSRQCTLINGAGYPNSTVDFNVTDAPNFCATTNQAAYQWALATAGSSTQTRYNTYGQIWTFGDDLPKQGGPFWIYAPLQYNAVNDTHGNPIIQVVAPMAKTHLDEWQRDFPGIPRPSWIPDPGCFHYCKLLSPARAMEWIYVDGLRLKRGLTPGGR